MGVSASAQTRNSYLGLISDMAVLVNRGIRTKYKDITGRIKDCCRFARCVATSVLAWREICSQQLTADTQLPGCSSLGFVELALEMIGSLAYPSARCLIATRVQRNRVPGRRQSSLPLRS